VCNGTSASFWRRASATIAVALAAKLLFACQTDAQVEAIRGSKHAPTELNRSATTPLPRIVARSCQGCHAVRANLPSPNRDAPSFAAIANLEGLTPNTLGTFLRDAHNYPEEMKMTLEKHEVDEIVSYMLTLSSPDYRPIP